MTPDRLQLQRLELKYQIGEDVALAVRDFVSSYLELDEFGATRPNLSYPVHSLYLDSPTLATYRHTINGNKNRFKLRIRFYENRAGAPVYLEIKRRVDNAILKQRGAIRREAVDRVLAGQLPDPNEVASSVPRHLVAIQRFFTLQSELCARPVAHIAYLREAWMSPRDNSVRVTMDREVRFEPDPTTRLEATMEDPIVVFGSRVILELKFTGRFPNWWQELVAVFGLQRGSAAKYADGIALYGEARLRSALDMRLAMHLPPNPDRLPTHPSALSFAGA